MEKFDTEGGIVERRWVRNLRRVGIVLGVLLLLFVISYFIVTSSGFIKSVVLPRVGGSLGAEITAKHVDLSPFSELHVQDLVVRTTGPEPLLRAPEARIRYGLFSILKGRIAVDEITLNAPVVHLVYETNGTSNLDPILKTGDDKPKPSSKEPTQLSIHNVKLQNGTVHRIQKTAGGGAETVQLSGLNITLDHLQNGSSGKLSLAAQLRMDTPAMTNAEASSLEGTIQGTYDFALERDLQPKTIQGSTRIEMTQGAGVYRDFAGYSAALDVNLTPTDVREVALKFRQADRDLGQLRMSGPLDLTKTEGRLTVLLQSLDKRVLNLFGAARGWDFAGTTFNATNIINIVQGGKVIGASGRLGGRDVQLIQNQRATPSVQLLAEYNVTVDLNEQTAVINRLYLDAGQPAGRLIRAELDKPMMLTWGEQQKGFTESSLTVHATNVHLGDWSFLAGTNLPNGTADLDLTLMSGRDGRVLQLDLTSRIRGLEAQIGSNRLQQAYLELKAGGDVQNLKTVDVKALEFTLAQGDGGAIARGQGSARLDLGSNDLNAQTELALELPALLRIVPVAGVEAKSGAVQISAFIVQRGEKQTFTGNIQLAKFAGRYGAYAFQDFQAGLEYHAEREGAVVTLHRADVTLRHEYKDGGSISLTGKGNLEETTGQIQFRIIGVNESGLRPFLAPSLGENQLVSINLNGSGSATYQTNGNAAASADIAIRDLIVRDPERTLPESPLHAQLQFESALQQKKLEVRQCLLTLTPTARAKNELHLKGRLDLTQTNLTTGQWTVAAESLDLTPYYALLGDSQTNAPAAPAPAPPPTETAPAPAAELPLQITADIRIQRLFLGELAVSNLTATAKVDRNLVELKPLQLTVNGGPIAGDATVDLSVPGSRYTFNLEAAQVPLKPLVNTFAPASSNRVTGDLMLKTSISGVGSTGASLKESLRGDFSLTLTNLDLQLVGPKKERLLLPIALVLRVPELADTPLNWINARAVLGAGKINVTDFTVLSAAFVASGRGIIPIADILTNSPLDLPVDLSLRRGLADRINLVPSGTASNAAYVLLPPFVKLAGTLGDPQTAVDKVRISGLLLRSIGGIPQLGDETSSRLQDLGGILSGQTSAPRGTNAPSTNAPAALNPMELLKTIQRATGSTNANPGATNRPGFNPLDLLNRIQPNRASTNQPPKATNNPATNKPSTNPLDVLRIFRR